MNSEIAQKRSPRQIYLFNSLKHNVEEFVPNTPNEVRIYTCGPTVYHYAHIGNLRTYIMEDVLEKMFRYVGYQVKRAMNITDVGHLTGDSDDGNDKMLIGAKRENRTVMEIADFYTKAFFEDCKKLNIKKTGNGGTRHKLYKRVHIYDRSPFGKRVRLYFRRQRIF